LEQLLCGLVSGIKSNVVSELSFGFVKQAGYCIKRAALNP
jgi:hypothetical protein